MADLQSHANYLPDFARNNPLEISEGGIYQGLTINTQDFDIPGIKISTTEPVTLRGCVVSGPGELIITTVPNTCLTVEHCYIWGTNPNLPDEQQGRWMRALECAYFVCRNNFIDQTGGMLVRGVNGDGVKSAIIERNIHKDLTSLMSNGSGKPGRAGYGNKRRSGQWNRQFVILRDNNVPDDTTKAPVVRYNVVVNNEFAKDNVSATEDLINCYGSKGTSWGNPVLIEKNFLRGSHGPQPFNPHIQHSGSGIITDASALSKGYFGFIEIRENRICYAQNVGIGTANGQNIRVHGNTIINPLFGEDGKQVSGYYSSGGYVYQWKPDQPLTNIAFYENKSHCYRTKNCDPGSAVERHDYWFPDCNADKNNRCWDNESLQGPMDHSHVVQLFQEFKKMLVDEGVSVGPDWGPGFDLVDFSTD